MSSAVRRPARTAPAAFHSSWNLSGRLAGFQVRVGPLVQPLAIVAAEEIVGVGDVPVE
jgi:hypothetical protein